MPIYTEEGRKNRVAGVVLLRAIIRKDGTVDKVEVLKGLGYGLDESAVNTISKAWQFEPGMLNGQPVDVMVSMEVSFRLY